MKAEEYNSESIKNRLRNRNPIERDKVKLRMLISVRIADAMRIKGWSKTDLAKELNQYESLVTRWLSGANNFTIDTLYEISKALGIEISSLFKMEEPGIICANEWIVSEPSNMYSYLNASTFDKPTGAPQVKNLYAKGQILLMNYSGEPAFG